MAKFQKITPFLWFDRQAEEAVTLYTSLFEDSRVTQATRYGANAPQPEGTVMTMSFQLAGQSFVALNGGPVYQFSPAISFVVTCETQAEIDTLWEKLAEGGGTQRQCGWLQDRYGVSWQIVPAALSKLLREGDAASSGRVMQALWQMTKLDIAALEAAAAGG